MFGLPKTHYSVIETTKVYSKYEEIARENELFSDISSFFGENPNDFSKSLKELCDFFEIKKNYTETDNLYTENIIDICFKYIKDDNENSLNATRVIFYIISSSSTSLYKYIIDHSLFDIINYLLAKSEESASIAIDYLSIICRNIEIRKIVLDSFDFNSFLEMIDFGPDKCIGEKIASLCENMSIDFPDESIIPLIETVLSKNIPEKFLSKFIKIIHFLLQNKPKSLKNEVLHKTRLQEFINEAFDLQNEPDNEETRDLYLEVLKLRVDTEVGFRFDDLMRLMNFECYKPIISSFLEFLWKTVESNENNIQIRDGIVNSFFENGGYDIVSDLIEDGSYIEAKYSVYFIGAKISIEDDKVAFLSNFKPSWISRICDLINDDESDHIFINMCIGILFSLLLFEDVSGGNEFLNEIVKSNISEILANINDSEDIAEYACMLLEKVDKCLNP